MSFGYLGDTSTKIKQVKKNDGVISIAEAYELEKLGHLGGSLELIQSQTYSSTVSAVDFTSIKENKYDVHLLQINGYTSPNGSQDFGLRFYESGVLETGSVYEYGHQYVEAGGSNGALQSTGNTYIYWSYNNNGTTQDARDSENGYIYFYNLGESSKFSYTTHQQLFNDGGGMKMSFGSGVLPQTSVVDGIRLKMISGNNSSGTASLYGLKEYS